MLKLVGHSKVLIFQQNNSAQTSMLTVFTSRYYSFFEKLKIVEKNMCKLNCSYGKVSYTLNKFEMLLIIPQHARKENLTFRWSHYEGIPAFFF